MQDITTYEETTADEVGQHPWEVEDNSWYGDNVQDERSFPPLPVLEMRGGMIVLRQDLMGVGRPVAFVLEGVPVVAIKRASGDVDFFTIPTKR